MKSEKFRAPQARETFLLYNLLSEYELSIRQFNPLNLREKFFSLNPR